MLSKQKYSRAAKDQSQLQQFVDEVCEESKRLLPEIKSGDAHKVLKVKADGSGTEYDFVDISEITAKGDIPASIKELIESLGGIQFNKYYIFDNGVKVVETVPEDYNGVVWFFEFIDEWDMTLSIFTYENGKELYCTVIGDSGIDNGDAAFTRHGVNKLNFAELTHSFTELDPTLKQIVDDAIAAGGDGVACTQEQWNAIKSLLDKSLYLNYNDYSMIKSIVILDQYTFGVDCNDTLELASCLRIYYDANNNLLYAIYKEL